MKQAPLLIEIGCEEIPARMIQPAAADLAARVEKALEGAGLEHGAVVFWGGSRRLTVRVDHVAESQLEREETVLGPAVGAAFDAEGRPTNAAAGFARKQGVEASALQRIETERGAYVGLRRRVPGRDVGEILAGVLPQAVESMTFPKVMRWGDGQRRWVRPVHWLVALHDGRVLPISLLGVEAGRLSRGHRFLAPGPVEVGDAEAYAKALEKAYVIVDPVLRRERLAEGMRRAAATFGGVPIEDTALLEEIADLVEWPGIVAGSFDRSYLALPRELLVTTLRHHQKCFSLRDPSGNLLPHFLAVANTDQDRRGHVQRGNEWVIGGRLEDAQFFWREDRRMPLADRSAALERVIVHAKLGSYADKARRMEELAHRLAVIVGLDAESAKQAALAARLAKNDLVTGTVGEFPELQGRVGGLLLEAEGAATAVSRAVYEQYQPIGPTDAIPATAAGRVVAAADKLDTLARFLAIGEAPTGSRDPFGLRRASNGLLRIAIEAEWPITLNQLASLEPDASSAVHAFLSERVVSFFKETGHTANEVFAVLKPRVGDGAAHATALVELAARLRAIRSVRGRDDFIRLVKLTERVDTILLRNEASGATQVNAASAPRVHEATAALDQRIKLSLPLIEQAQAKRDYEGIVETLAGLVQPVDRFFVEVLVIDPEDPHGTQQRWNLLAELRALLVRHFDIRELAGQADRRA